MMRAIVLALFATLLFCAPVETRIGRHHGGVANGGAPGECAAFAGDNGCALAQANGSFKPANLLTTVTQAGQNSLLSTHPMTFNIPGVDYGIGPASTLTPQDPRTIVVTASTPCAYIGTGGNAPPNDYVGCFGAGTYPNAVLDNYDFSGAKIGKSALHLFMNTDASAGSVMTVTNSYFSATASSGPVEWAGNWSLVYKNNQCDGTGSTGTSPYCINDDVDVVGSSIDLEYNAFTNIQTPRIAGGANYATFTMKYNFMEINNLNSSIHGEIMLRNCSGARANCTPFDYYEGNFIVWDPPFTSGLNNATVFPGDGASDGVALSSFTFKNNIVVTNKNGSNQTAINDALFNARLSTMGVVTMTGNWADASGADDCSLSGAKSGGNTVTAQSSGNTLTVTGLSTSFGNNPIEPGWIISHSGFTQTTITAYGTGVGNTGTYTFGGATQAVGSDSLWTLVPGFTSATLTGNFNLNDPSHTGTPQAMNLSGLQFTAGTCVN